MKRMQIKVICLALVLALCGAGMALAADEGTAINNSYTLISHGKYAQAQKLLDQVLAKDPGNPVALNNLAAAMVGMKKFDKADTYLNQALPKAQGYMVAVNRVCTVGNICVALMPVSGEKGDQDLGPLVKMNMEMVKGMMEAAPIPGKGLR
ncbi:MAG: tetratricopeptide repeat protein [Desulfobaccales bacterium]|jgi:tetratricopeptide (TPR) repeat protein